MSRNSKVEIDIPCDVQQVDETGHPWAFIDEARDRSVVVEGAIVIAADEDDPVLSLRPHKRGGLVHLEVAPGDRQEYATALWRAHLLPA